MRLKSDFITQDIDGTQFLVPIGGSTINGLARSNADRATIASDVREILDKLRLLDALEE